MVHSLKKKILSQVPTVASVFVFLCVDITALFVDLPPLLKKGNLIMGPDLVEFTPDKYVSVTFSGMAASAW